LLAVLSKGPDHRLVGSLLKEMEAKGLQLDTVTFDFLVKIAVMRKNLHDGFKQIKNAKKLGVRLSANSYVLLARELAKMNHFDETEKTLEMMEEEGHEVPQFLRIRIEGLRSNAEQEQAPDEKLWNLKFFQAPKNPNYNYNYNSKRRQDKR